LHWKEEGYLSHGRSNTGLQLLLSRWFRKKDASIAGHDALQKVPPSRFCTTAAVTPTTVTLNPKQLSADPHIRRDHGCSNMSVAKLLLLHANYAVQLKGTKVAKR
jgi:hypothetical protein